MKEFYFDNSMQDVWCVSSIDRNSAVGIIRLLCPQVELHCRKSGNEEQCTERWDATVFCPVTVLLNIYHLSPYFLPYCSGRNKRLSLGSSTSGKFSLWSRKPGTKFSVPCCRHRRHPSSSLPWLNVQMSGYLHGWEISTLPSTCSAAMIYLFIYKRKQYILAGN